jgi:hypothetical protein
MAEFNKTESIDGLTRFYNEKLNISTLNYGDVKFAFSTKEFKKMNQNAKPVFKNVLFYGETFIAPFYNYYLLEGKAYTPNKLYNIHEYTFEGSTFLLAISVYTPAADTDLIKSNISQYLK